MGVNYTVWVQFEDPYHYCWCCWFYHSFIPLQPLHISSLLKMSLYKSILIMIDILLILLCMFSSIQSMCKDIIKMCWKKITQGSGPHGNIVKLGWKQTQVHQVQPFQMKPRLHTYNKHTHIDPSIHYYKLLYLPISMLFKMKVLIFQV